MRFAICSTLVLGLAGLAACENTPIGSSLVNRPTVTSPSDAGAAPPSGGGVVNDPTRDATADVATLADRAVSTADVAREAGSSTEVSVAGPDAHAAGGDILGPAPDANDTRDAVAAERAPLLSCAALAAAGKADQLETFQWMYEVGPGGSGSYGRPYDTITLTKACQMTYQKTILPKPLPPALRPSSPSSAALRRTASCSSVSVMMSLPLALAPPPIARVPTPGWNNGKTLLRRSILNRGQARTNRNALQYCATLHLANHASTP